MTRNDYAHLIKDKTPIYFEDKTKILAHINEEHSGELILFAKTLVKPAIANIDKSTQITLLDIFNEGILLKIEDANTPASYRFIDFINAKNEVSPITSLAEVKEAYVTLLQKATKKAGKPSIKIQQGEFKLLDSHYVSPNMLRLHCIAPDDTPLHQPGYAYLFDLISVTRASTKTTTNSTANAHATDSNQATRAQCYYTLRKAWQQAGQTHAWIDVYIHGATPGGNWATSLQAQDKFYSLREYPESIEHLGSGQCLLIADETSVPTVAWLLETWQNPVAPVVIIISNDIKEIAYYDDIKLAKPLQDLLNRHSAETCQVHHIVKTADTDLTSEIANLLQTHSHLSKMNFEKVWGALEASDAKALRKQLRDTLSLSRQDMVLKTYWRKS